METDTFTIALPRELGQKVRRIAASTRPHKRVSDVLREIVSKSLEISAPSESEEIEAEIRVGELTLIPSKHDALWRSEHHIRLTKQEYLAVMLLARRPGMFFSREKIYEAIKGSGYVDYCKYNVSCVVKRIRGQFKSVDPGFDQIECRYQVGYRWKKPE